MHPPYERVHVAAKPSTHRIETLTARIQSQHTAGIGGPRMSRYRPLILLIAVAGVAIAGVGLAGAAENATAQVVHDGDRPTLPAGPNQTLTIRTSLEESANVSVRITSTDPESPFLATASATVDADGLARPRVDLSNVEPGTGMEITVRHDGQTLARTNGTVTACDGRCEPPSVTTAADSAGTSLVYDGEQPTLAAGPGQTLTGRTDLEPGTVLRVRLRSQSSGSPFLRTTQATVDETGTFTATVDLAAESPGTEFGILVYQGEERLLQTTGEVVPCDGTCTPTSDPDQDSTSRTDVVQTDTVDIASIVEGASGETVPIQVSVGDRDDATVAVGGPDVNYRLEATVTDGDGDRKVRLRLNTSAAGHDDAPTLSAAADADSVTVRHETSLDAGHGALDAAEYPMAVYASATTSGEPAARGTLVLHESIDAAASDTPVSDEVEPPANDEVGFHESIVRSRVGQRTSFTVATADASAVTLSVGGRESGMAVTATLRDGDGDGEVTLLFDTTAVGDAESPTLAPASDADTIDVEQDRAETRPIEPGDYDLAIYRGTETDGQPIDIATLVVEPSTTGTVDDASADSVAPANASGNVVLGGAALVGGGVLAIAGLAVLLGLLRG